MRRDIGLPKPKYQNQALVWKAQFVPQRPSDVFISVVGSDTDFPGLCEC